MTDTQLAVPEIRGDILVVDDIPENLRVAVCLLKGAGYKARGVLNGELALYAVANQPPNLILLDIRMPGMDGYQVCKALRAAPDSQDIPIIFLSSYTDIEEKQLAFDAGGVDYITKPFEAGELLARVHTHMELARHRTELIHTRNMLENLSKKQTQVARTELARTDGQVQPEHVPDILVVMGESGHLEPMLALLQGQAYETRGVTSGKMAMAAIATAQPNLIITDLRLNDMDGFELCSALQERSESRDIPLIFLTQEMNAETIERAFKAGVVDCLVQPVKPKEMLARINIHLRLHQVQRGLEQLVADRSAELLASEERYRSIFDTMEEAYVLVDMAGTILLVNPATLSHLKYNHVLELVGKNIASQLYVHPGDRDILLQSLSKNGKVSGFVTQFKRKDGTVILVDINAHVTYDTEGRPAAIEGTLRDITERKHTEEALMNLQKLESLGILAAGIAHDFNNLMGGVFGYLSMANQASQEPKVKDYLSHASKALDRARSLTGQLMTFAKGGAPKLEVAPLFPFVQDAAKFALSGSNTACQFVIEEGLWHANMDKNQIGQVIDNIIINAWQAMPDGGTITVAASNASLASDEHALLKKGKYIQLAISDTGIGIPKDMQKRIFDPFFTTKSKGHGIGLATCYSIVNRHGGTIDVASDPGKGTTFTVYLPAAIENVSYALEMQKRTHRGRGRFLLMDDEVMLLEVTSTILETFGYEVDGAANGEEAVASVATALKNDTLPVAMLFDLTVRGGMGGAEAISRIREMGVTVPAFVTSGYADDPVMQRPTEYGFTASIDKPFRWSELSALLEKHLGLGKGEA